MSASLVEPHAKSMPCPKCAGACAVVEHAAETQQGQRLRIAHMMCKGCGGRRAIYFRIVGDFLN
jgi:C4-type Zn-finger protein